MSITVNNNKVNYTTPANVSDGINFLNSTFLKVASYHSKGVCTTGDYQFTINSNIIVCPPVFTHIYGTVTKDITKKLLYYSINNQYNTGKNQTTIAIPCNPYNPVDTFDVVYLNHVAEACKNYIVYLKTHNSINSFTNVNAVVDIYVDVYRM